MFIYRRVIPFLEMCEAHKHGGKRLTQLSVGFEMEKPWVLLCPRYSMVRTYSYTQVMSRVRLENNMCFFCSFPSFQLMIFYAGLCWWFVFY